MFADEDQEAKLNRYPVAPAKRSDAAMKKKVASCAQDAPTFQITTIANPKQKHALELIAQIMM